MKEVPRWLGEGEGEGGEIASRTDGGLTDHGLGVRGLYIYCLRAYMYRSRAVWHSCVDSPGCRAMGVR